MAFCQLSVHHVPARAYELRPPCGCCDGSLIKGHVRSAHMYGQYIVLLCAYVRSAHMHIQYMCTLCTYVQAVHMSSICLLPLYSLYICLLFKLFYASAYVHCVHMHNLHMIYSVFNFIIWNIWVNICTSCTYGRCKIVYSKQCYTKSLNNQLCLFQYGDDKMNKGDVKEVIEFTYKWLKNKNGILKNSVISIRRILKELKKAYERNDEHLVRQLLEVLNCYLMTLEYTSESLDILMDYLKNVDRIFGKPYVIHNE